MSFPDPDKTVPAISRRRGREIGLLLAWTALVLLLGALLLRRWGCGSRVGDEPRSGSRWTYHLGREESGAIAVKLEIELSGPPGPVRLESAVAADHVERARLEVRNPSGSVLGGVRSPRSELHPTIGGALTPLEHEDLVLDPDPSEKAVIVTYTVHALPSRSGLSRAVTTRDKAVLPGRWLFLVPSRETPFTAEVRVAADPMLHWFPGEERPGDPRERLLDSLLVVGSFEEMPRKAEETGIDVHLDPDLAPRFRESAVATLERLVRRVEELMPRSPGPRRFHLFFLAGLPLEEGLAADGLRGALAIDMDLHRPTWRWNRILQALLERRTVSPERFAPEDAWLVPGGVAYIASRLLAGEDLLDLDLHRRRLLRSHARSRLEGRPGRLAGHRAAPVPIQALQKQVQAPLTLEKMEAVMAASGVSRPELVHLVGRFLASPSAVSEGWMRFVKTETSVDLLDFYRAFVAGTESLVFSTWEPPDPLSSGSTPPQTARELGLFVLEGTFGDRVPCEGCPPGEERMVRREDLVSRLAGSRPRLVLHAGDALPLRRGARMDPAAFAEMKERFIRLGSLKPDAYVPSVRDLSWGPGFLRELEESVAFPFVSCNLVSPETGAPLFASRVEAEVDGVSVALIGVSAPEIDLFVARTRERMAQAVRLEEPVASILHEAREVRDAVDLVAVVGELSPGKIRQLARVPGLVDLVISSDPHLDGMAKQDPSGRIGGLTVLYAISQNSGIDAGRLAVTMDGAMRLYTVGWEPIRWE